MIKIPASNKRIVVTNGKDALQGSLAYTKNINLDETGYIKLSAPMVQVFGDSLTGLDASAANFDLPIDMFQYSDTAFKVITNDKVFNYTTTTGGISEDTGIASNATDTTRAALWKDNKWYLGLDEIDSYDGTSGTTTYASFVAILAEYLTAFTSLNYLVGSTGSTVKAYDEAASLIETLVIPDNFNIEGMAYSNNLLGIITRQKKNQGDAFFFTWDGLTAAANAGYPVNDSFLTGVEGYRSSWVIFTSAGELLYFNGGGFQQLGTLPQFDLEDDFIQLGTSNSTTIGKQLDIEGDLVFVNAPSLPEQSNDNKAYQPYASGGVYCYDPKASFYHRHAPSYSTYVNETGSSTSNVVTLTEHFLETGDEVFVGATTAGLTANTVYYAIKMSDTTIKLATSYDNAVAGTSTTVNDGSPVLHFCQRKDFGIEAQRINDCGLVHKSRGYNGYTSTGILPFFMGTEVRPNDVSAVRQSVLCALAPKVSNKGYFVTGRFQATNLEDHWDSAVIKHDKLSAQSSIVVKAKTTTDEPIIVGDVTLYDDTYTGPSAIWTSPDTFETTVDLANAEVGDEVHIFDGCASGQSAHIDSIDLTGSTYTVSLDENLRGVESSKRFCCVIDKYKKIGTITRSNSDGVKELPVHGQSQTVQLKVELRGVGVKVSEVQVINKAYNPHR